MTLNGEKKALDNPDLLLEQKIESFRLLGVSTKNRNERIYAFLYMKTLISKRSRQQIILMESKIK